MIQTKLIVYAVIAVLFIGGAAFLYYKGYFSGKTTVYVEQEKKLNTIKDKTNAAKTDALTTSDPKSELRKYSRPND